MAAVICSEQAQSALEAVPPSTREGIERRLDYLQQMPRMYARTEDERFPGCRSFWVEPCYRIFYMVAASADDVYVAAVVEEEVGDRGDGAGL